MGGGARGSCSLSLLQWGRHAGGFSRVAVASLILSRSGSGCGWGVQTHFFQQVQIQVKTGRKCYSDSRGSCSVHHVEARAKRLAHSAFTGQRGP